ncbi:hypothetical protein PCANC_26875 [Puccinia coronata f. sp. avenae]|uniref:Uncharacterized protein n=1 Tax=Puccinia coronata f. sp. avenae TaxID=200324 RepID=A0A2N5TLX4_9BASI|nr:hypothetical protein PCANC_26875 [Puccinia coronata f. sp. avenae]
MSTNTKPSNVNTQSTNPNTGNNTQSPTSLVTVTPHVWAQMQRLLALLPAQPNAKHSLAKVDQSPNPVGQSFTVPNVVVSPPLCFTIDNQEDDDNLPNLDKNDPKDGRGINQASNPLTPSVIAEKEELACPIITPTSIVNEQKPTPPLIVINIEKYNFGTGRPLDPPPSSRFTSMDHLFQFCQLWARSHGYAIFKLNSHPGKNVYIKCD